MKNFMLTLLLLVGLTVSAQQVEPKVLDWENPIAKIDNVEYRLIDVDSDGTHILKFTRFTENGKVIETGMLKNRKPHGEWRSYDIQGEVIAIAEFKNGKRIKVVSFQDDGKVYTILYKSKVNYGTQIAQVVIDL